MTQVLDEAMKTLKHYPEIATRIAADQEAHGQRKKHQRLADASWSEARTLPLPLAEMLPEKEPEVKADGIILEVGRPRMRAEVVYLFLVLRGCYGSVSDEWSWDRFADSLTLRCYLEPYMSNLPGRTTVLENVNAVSEETKEYIFKRHLAAVLGLGLDDFAEVTVDSTAIWANSAWPTDIGVLEKLVNRACLWGGKLAHFGVPNMNAWHLSRWLQEVGVLSAQIAMASGKKKGREMKKSYRKLAKRVGQIVDYLVEEYERLEALALGVDACPSQRARLDWVWERLGQDIGESAILLGYITEKVLGGGRQERAEAEKIYSISDRSASFIKKGNRPAVFGYKPQLNRSGNGFITGVAVPEGNAADATQFEAMMKLHIAMTGVIPEVASSDDGYASGAGVERVKALGIKAVSVNGSKGKKLTAPEDWESEVYVEARRYRSAIESMMFTGKHSFEFGQCHRRGQEAVRGEMLEKAIAYNFWRMGHERRRQAEERRCRQAA
jgi:hypothetical protein